MARYRRKAVVIEATQYLRDDGTIEGLCYEPHHNDGNVHVHTLEGPLTVSLGDWVATGVEGERYPIKPSVFAKIYEPADD